MNKIPLIAQISCEQLAKTMVGATYEKSAVSAILYFEDAAKLLRELLKYDTVNVFDIDLHSEDSRRYYDLFAVSLSMDGKLFVQPIFVEDEDKYLSVCADYVYIDRCADILKEVEETTLESFPDTYIIRMDFGK